MHNYNRTNVIRTAQRTDGHLKMYGDSIAGHSDTAMLLEGQAFINNLVETTLLTFKLKRCSVSGWLC